jgi:acyl-CoA dehydrogenase
MTYASPFYDKDHEEFRIQARRFVEKEISPYVEAWETEGRMPRELHLKAAEAGLLQIGFPERCGGIEVPDLFYGIVLTEELARSGSGGVIASLMSHSIGTPPICHVGSFELQARFARPVLEGRKIAALAITEPGGGSDVANLKTRAERDGDHYVVNGSKTFITSGMRADYLTCAVRTGGPGMGGVSLLVIEGDTPGLNRTPLDKMGWRCSDTATLYFDNCRVPVANLVGRENQGFMAIMLNFNQERIMLAAQAYAFAKVCYEESVEYARSRETFGKALIRNQVMRHKLVDMRMRLEAVKANLDLVAWRVSNRQAPIAEVCMLKNFACTSLEWIANESLQVFGGAGYLRGAKVERIYRETKVLTIGGGSLEIMKDLAAKQLGL